MSLTGVLRTGLGVGSLGFWILACGTDAVGVSQCRTIEATRCRAGAECGLVDDLDACLRFTRDNCLHGTPANAAPKSSEVRDCVELLEQARECAADSRRTTPAACSIELVPGAEAANVCDVILEPEFAQDCSFLLEEPPEEEEPAPSNPDAGSDAGN